jgi:hypothetical protein
MAYVIRYEEPTGFAVGDRVEWKRILADYPVSESWTLKYYLRGNFAEGRIDITATTSGTEYLVDISPTVSAEYTPGIYYWQSFVEIAGTDRKPIGSGRFIITPDISDITEPVDGRSHARRCLDSINAVMENRATRDDQSYAMQAVGRSVTKMPIKDLMAFRDYYLTEVNREEAALKPNRKNIYVRFLR